ncbi:hypothetical protein EV191_107119 [Tamaricihabitans halophyticus]|uniref:Uncharacterized protein n=1 Tax=Tamaricihabitans halophyticus TaxID=1262583 RepID=A0A4R2QUT6_9PSEU|nr:hypothetical protein EV191_107119 [Tamaricihabitans halophyticus]
MWTAAWLHGAAATDDVLDALAVWREHHDVVAADHTAADELDLPMRGSYPASPVQLLAALRRVGTVGTRLVLPAPGDVRGLGGQTSFATAALTAREGVVLTGARFGLVPVPAADQVLSWTVHTLPSTAVVEHVGLGEAEHALSEALRSSAATLQSLDVAKGRPGVRDELRGRLATRPDPDWPAGMPQRALRVLQRANEVATILQLAAEDEPGAALSSAAANQRADALRPLDAAVRAARTAAVHEAIRVLAEGADHY